MNGVGHGVRPEVTAVEDAVVDRRSTRAFLDRPLPPGEIEHILTVAARTPSNSNTQPWHVHVLEGEAKSRLTAAIWDSLDRGVRLDPDYHYQPGDWPEPLNSRRRAFGEELYGEALGIDADDQDGRYAHHRRNYEFFGAPVGLIITVDQHARTGGFVDAGAFLQSIMVIARARGLDTCPQAAFNDFHPILRRQLGLPTRELVVCGLALGYADATHPLNRLRTARQPVTGFATFHR